MITLTESAKERIRDLIIDENTPGTFLRIYVQGGGCSGMQYQFVFDTVQADDDVVLSMGDWNLVTDSISLQYLDGVSVDYKEGLMESRFVVDNPNAVTHCGCGSSFSVG